MDTIVAISEYDSCTPQRVGRWGERQAVPCSKCGELEELVGDDADFDEAGDYRVSTVAENLQHCPDCSDCLLHAKCADNGLCPHCAHPGAEVILLEAAA